jgi:hypothetical protein
MVVEAAGPVLKGPFSRLNDLESLVRGVPIGLLKGVS